MPRRSRHWILRGSGDKHEVVLSGRTLRTGLTEQEARVFLQRHRSPADKVSIEAPDGYRSRF